MPYKNPSAHQQCRILITAEAHDELRALAASEERSVSYMAGRLIREALAVRGNRQVDLLTAK